MTKQVNDTCGQKNSSGWVGHYGAETGLQEALFRIGRSQGHSGAQSSGSVAHAAEPWHVVGQGGVPEVGAFQATYVLQKPRVLLRARRAQ